MLFSYVLSGLRLLCNVPIPGLPCAPERRRADVRIVLEGPARPLDSDEQSAPWYVSPHLGENGIACLRVWRPEAEGPYRLLYGDGSEFRLDARGRQVWGTWREPLTVDDLLTYLLGPVLGLVLRLHGVTCLHASAVAVDGRAVAFVGPPGAGKSTTAAALAQRGHAILADDSVALRRERDAIQAFPSYPGLRLWPESVAALYGRSDALPRCTPSKRYLDLRANGCHFQATPLPLAAVYFLDGREDQSSAPRIEPLRGPEGLLRLIADTYTNYLLDRPMRAREFALLGQLVGRVRLRRLVPREDRTRLPALCDLVLDDCRCLFQANGPPGAGRAVVSAAALP
jgi:hypothetical protein